MKWTHHNSTADSLVTCANYLIIPKLQVISYARISRTHMSTGQTSTCHISQRVICGYCRENGVACMKWRRSCRQYELLPISHPTQCLAAGVPVYPGAAPQICQTAAFRDCTRKARPGGFAPQQNI